MEKFRLNIFWLNGRKSHGMKEIPKDLQEKMRKLIREEKARAVHRRDEGNGIGLHQRRRTSTRLPPPERPGAKRDSFQT